MTVLLIVPAVAVVHQPATLTLLFPGGARPGTAVQLSDHDAGGTFLPAVVIPQAGDDRASVSYAPTVDGPIQISTTPPSTCCLPARCNPTDVFPVLAALSTVTSVSADGLTLTVQSIPPPYRYLLVNGGANFRRGLYQVVAIRGSSIALDRPCTRGIVNPAELDGALLTVINTGSFLLQSQRFWPCHRTGITLFVRPTTMTVVITGKRSNIFYLGEPITLTARKGTVVSRFAVRDLRGDVIAEGPFDSSATHDATVAVHIDRCGYYLVDYFGEAADRVFGSCAASAPLVVLHPSTSGLMNRPAYASIYGDFSATPLTTTVDLMQWINPPGPVAVPWYAIATGEVAARRTGTYVLRITCAAGGARLRVLGRIVLDCMNDPTLGAVAVSDPIAMRVGDRQDVVYECSGITTAHRPAIEMSLDGGSHWQRLVFDQFPSQAATAASGLTIRYLTPLFNFRPRPGFDFFTVFACGLGIERLSIVNGSNPGPEADEWESVIDVRLARRGTGGAVRRNESFIQFTAYRQPTRLSEAASPGTLTLQVRSAFLGVGATVRIGEETHRIRSVQNTTITLATPLNVGYAAETLVRNDPITEDAAVTATVRRFLGKVLLWECTNEPDQFRPTIEHVACMRSFYAAVKAAAPGSASIVLGPSTTSANRELDPGGYVDVIAREGGLTFVDGFAFHAYNQVDGEYLQACRGMEKIRAFLSAHNAAHLPIYQTEQGYQADLYGVFEPWHQINWLLAHRLAFDRYDLPLERDFFWTTRDHGDPAFACHLITTFGLLTPAWLLLRTYSDALDGANFADSYDLGSAEGLFVASRYARADGKTVAVFWSPGDPDATLDLQVTGGDTLALRDGWGNRADVPVVNGRVTLTQLQVPVYVELAERQAVRPAPLLWGTNVARSAAVSSNGTAGNLSAINNGSVELSFFDGAIPFTETGDSTSGVVLPAVITLGWAEPQTIARTVIRCPAPWQSRGSLLAYDLQFLDSNGQWQTLVSLVTRLPRAEAILQPGFNASTRDFWDRKHVFHHVLPTAVRSTSIRLRIFASSWGGEACQLTIEAGGQGVSGIAPAISEWRVYAS